MSRGFVLLIGLLWAVPAHAEDAAPAAGRYAVQPSEGGFVRLDTLTGAVSHCGKRDGVWHCDVLAEDRSATTARLDALAAEVKALAAKVEALQAQLDAAPPAEPSALTPEEEAKIDKAMGFSETLMRRLFGLVRAMKQEAAEGGG